MLGLLVTVQSLGKPTTFVNDLFLSEESNILNINLNLINKQRCMANLLYHYLTTGDIPKSLNVNNKVYHVRQDAFNALELFTEQRKPSELLKDLIKQLSGIYENISIGDLVVFLETQLKEKEKTLSDLNRHKNDFKSINGQDFYARLLDNLRGCPSLCPCCKRPCDVDHTQIKSNPGSENNEHSCLSGHTLRAMNGYKFEGTGEASLYTCEQIDNDQVIVVGPTRYLWSEFKKQHPDWKFESALTDDELIRSHGKFLTVWEKIGPQLCEQYGMKYVTHNSMPRIGHKPYHYILLLDGSGSMQGRNWNDLLAAVKEFIEQRQKLATNDRITVIVFSSEAKVVLANTPIRQMSEMKIKYPGGNTSFSKAFRAVHNCISEFKMKANSEPVNENFAIIFMSDGEDTYPEKELNQLLKEHDPVIKRFWTIALCNNKSVFGGLLRKFKKSHLSVSSDKEVLERINIKMNGSFYDVATSADLKQSYAEVATCP